MTTPNPTPTPQSQPPVTLESAHLSLVSVGVIFLVILTMVEVGGHSPQVAEWMILALLSALLLRGMANNGYFAASLANYPWIP